MPFTNIFILEGKVGRIGEPKLFGPENRTRLAFTVGQTRWEKVLPEPYEKQSKHRDNWTVRHLWFQCVSWDEVAAYVLDEVQEGDSVIVSGVVHVANSPYIPPDGSEPKQTLTAFRLQLVVKNIQLLASHQTKKSIFSRRSEPKDYGLETERPGGFSQQPPGPAKKEPF